MASGTQRAGQCPRPPHGRPAPALGCHPGRVMTAAREQKAFAWRLACALEPVAVLPRFRDRDRLVALVGSWAGGGAIVAFDPVECSDDVRVLAREGASPQVVTPDRPKVAPAWLGVLGYRVGGLVEHVPWQSHRPDPQPDCDLARYETLLRYDADSGSWWFEGTCRADALGQAREACDAIQNILCRFRVAD